MPKTLLLKTLGILRTPNHWCRGAVARNLQGNPVQPTDRTAVFFDMAGALMKIAHDEHLGKSRERRLAFRFILEEVQKLGFAEVALANDELAHSEVLQVLERAIIAATGQEDNYWQKKADEALGVSS